MLEPAPAGGWSDVLLVNYISGLLAEAPGAEHRALTEVTGAVLREAEPSPLLGGLHMLDETLRRSIDEAKAAGFIDQGMATDAVVAVVRSVYLGAITSKAWGMEQPDLDDVRKVLTAFTQGIAPR